MATARGMNVTIPFSDGWNASNPASAKSRGTKIQGYSGVEHTADHRHRVETERATDHFTPMLARRKSHGPTKLIQEWPLPPAVTLGSSVRARGILLEVRAQLPPTVKKLIEIEARSLVLRVSIDDENMHDELCVRVSQLLQGIESLPVIPREAEDILTMSTAERHRWLKDGRLQSAGTRTVKLRGRARKITFHVFDPRHIEDVLDRDLPATWRGCRLDEGKVRLSAGDGLRWV